MKKLGAPTVVILGVAVVGAVLLARHLLNETPKRVAFELDQHLRRQQDLAGLYGGATMPAYRVIRQ